MPARKVNEIGKWAGSEAASLTIDDLVLPAGDAAHPMAMLYSEDASDEITAMDGPQVMLMHPASSSLFVSSYHRDQIMVVDSSTGKKKRELGGNELQRPVGLAAAPNDELLVASHKGNAILRYNASAASFVDVFAQGHGLWAPTGLAMTSDLVLFVGTFMDGLRRYSFWR